jgi:hypothetical protein
MSQRPSRLPIIGLALLITLGLGLTVAPGPMTAILNGVVTLWSVALPLIVIGTLTGFLYWFFLRRWLRMRRIAIAREKRLIREALSRE